MKRFQISVRTKITLIQSFIVLFFIIACILQINSVFRLRDINQVHVNFIRLQNEFNENEALIKDIIVTKSLTLGLEETNIKVKGIVSRMDVLLANLSPSLSTHQKSILKKEAESVSASLHEYSVLLDELSRRTKGLQANSRTEAQKILDNTASFLNFSSSVKNEYFAFLLKDISDLSRRYSITPGNDILIKLNGRLEEAGKILSTNDAVTFIASGESSKTILFSKLSDTKILVTSILENSSKTVSLEEGTINRLNRASIELKRDITVIDRIIDALYSSFFKNTLVMELFLLLVLAFILVFYFRRYAKSQLSFIYRIEKMIRQLVSGKLPEDTDLGKEIEFEGMGKDLGVFIGDLKQKASFAAEIGMGKLETSYLPLSEDDMLGNSLIEMQQSLHLANEEEEKHKTEEEMRRWINEGLARFADVVRSGNNNLVQLADHIIQNIVKYLKANQGGLFLVNDAQGDQSYLELTASFAYDRKKYLKKRIEIGEGLLGTCALEKETIMVTQLPDDYIEITSGLGEAPPNCLVLVPLKLENELLGVIEVASFNLFQPHEIDFLEKIAASIASTISSVKTNTRTSNLLVQSQQQAQELSEKEEEMRQSMEELQATQEESARRETEITGILNAINNSSFVLEVDMDSKIIDANQKLLDLLSINRDGLIGKKYSDIVAIETKSESYTLLWNELREGIHQSRIESIRSGVAKEIWLSVNFTPILDRMHKPYKVLCIASDISDSKIQEINIQKQSAEIARKNRELESLTLAVDSSLIKCIYDATSFIIDTNENYDKATGYSRNEMLGKENKMFLKADEEAQFNKIWSQVMKGKAYTGVLKRTKPTGEELWLMSTFTPVKDEKGGIYKVFFLGQDITEKKLKYKLLEEANKEIERLKKIAKE
jgi:PAS domain S-box-containing protein